MSLARRKSLVDKANKRLSIRRQCRLLDVSRSSLYTRPKQSESPENLHLMRLIDEQYLKTPFYGTRQMTRYLRRQGFTINRKRVRRLMRKMGLMAIYQAPRTSKPHPEHRVYSYLLRGLEIERVNRLIVDAIELVPALSDQRLVRVLAGHRSSVSDHFPLLGAVADFEEAAASLKTPPRSLKPEEPSIPHRQGCYIVTGFGGRGFVFGPLMGKILADKIVEGRAIAPELSADRYLLRALRKK